MEAVRKSYLKPHLQSFSSHRLSHLVGPALSQYGSVTLQGVRSAKLEQAEVYEIRLAQNDISQNIENCEEVRRA